MTEEEQELDRLGDAIMGGPVELSAERARMLGSLIGFLINNERGNVRANIHALMHCMPRWAAVNGYPSMRSSAIACGVSREYIRRRRNQWCLHLDLPIPKTKH